MNILYFLAIESLRCSDDSETTRKLSGDSNNPTFTEEKPFQTTKDSIELIKDEWFTFPFKLDEKIQISINSTTLENFDIENIKTLGDNPHLAWLSSFCVAFLSK